MRNKTWISAALVALLIGVTALASSPTTSPSITRSAPAKWEYAEYSTGYKYVDPTPVEGGVGRGASGKRQYFESFQTADEHHYQTSDEKEFATASLAMYRELGGDKANAAPTRLDILNLIGDKGWELAAEHEATYIFKRPKGGA